MDSLLVFAGIHSLHFGYFRLIARRFPYAIYYKVSGEEIVVYRVLDCRRKPEWIWNPEVLKQDKRYFL